MRSSSSSYNGYAIPFRLSAPRALPTVEYAWFLTIKLLNDAKIRHPVFYTTLLELINFKIFLQEIFCYKNNNVIKYKIERIIKYKLKKFLIK